MKLVFAVVNDEDGRKVNDELTRNGFSVTKLATTGGFLKAGNTTLLVGTEEDRVKDVVDIIKRKSHSRKQIITSPVSEGIPTGTSISYPIEVVTGGATIFVLDVEHFEKV